MEKELTIKQLIQDAATDNKKGRRFSRGQNAENILRMEKEEYTRKINHFMQYAKKYGYTFTKTVV